MLIGHRSNSKIIQFSIPKTFSGWKLGSSEDLLTFQQDAQSPGGERTQHHVFLKKYLAPSPGLCFMINQERDHLPSGRELSLRVFPNIAGTLFLRTFWKFSFLHCHFFHCFYWLLLKSFIYIFTCLYNSTDNEHLSQDFCVPGIVQSIYVHSFNLQDNPLDHILPLCPS